MMRDRDLQHPVITNMERTGYPYEVREHRCPCCGDICEKLYQVIGCHVVGCDCCIEEVDPWEFDERGD